MDFERTGMKGWVYEYTTAATPEFHEDVRLVFHVEIDRHESAAEVVKVLIVDGDGNEGEIGTGEINPKDTPYFYQAVCEVEDHALVDTAQDVEDCSEIELERDCWGEC